MVNWVFVAIIAVITASVIEGVKRIDLFGKKWKKDGWRCLVIMLIAFIVTTVITFLIGFGFGVCENILNACSYVLVTFFVQKAIGEEGLHRIIKKSAGVE